LYALISKDFFNDSDTTDVKFFSLDVAIFSH
jgi:hypothetical protein